MKFEKFYNSVFPLNIVNERVTDFYNTCEKYKNKNDVFFTFTEVQKVGLNPTSKYNTPLGVYCYPAKQVWDNYISINKILPFGQGHGMYVTFFTLKSFNNIIQDISKLDEQKFLAYFKKLDDLYKQKMNEPLTLKNIKQHYTKQYEQQDLVGVFAWYKKSLGHKLWAYTRDVANIIGGFGENMQDEDEWEVISNNIVKWNTVFREIGIYGVVDRSGAGIIHENEPIQAVIFNSSLINELDQIKYATTEGIKKEKLSINIPKEVIDRVENAKDLKELDLYDTNYNALPENTKNKFKELIRNEKNIVLISNYLDNKNTIFYKSLPNDVIQMLKDRVRLFWNK